jgi:hypothetical protein
MLTGPPPKFHGTRDILRGHGDRFVAISDVQAIAQQHSCEEQRVIAQIPVRRLIERANGAAPPTGD